MTLSTHVLDISTGLPAVGVAVVAERCDPSGWTLAASAVTDSDGRVNEFVEPGRWGAGQWRLIFDTGAYLGTEAFWPEVIVTFSVGDPTSHHHVPLLLSPYGYSTYRGS